MGQMLFPGEGSGSGGSYGCTIVCVLSIAAILYFGGWNWISSLFTDNSYPMCVMAEELNLRESGSMNGKIVTTKKYGEIVNVIDKDGTIWAKVKTDKETGYMSLRGLLSKEDFNRLNMAWGDSESRETVYELRWRKALVAFVSENLTNEDFHLFEAKGKNFWSHKTLGGHGCCAFILENRGTNERYAAIYSFDENYNPRCEQKEFGVNKNMTIKKISFKNGIDDIIYKKTHR